MLTCVWLFRVGDTVAFTQAGLHSFWPWSLIRILSFWWYCLTGMGIWSDWLQMGFRLSLPACLFPVVLETRDVHGFSLCVTGNRPGYLRISCKTGWVQDQFPPASPGHRAPQDLFLHTLYGRFTLTRTVVVQLLSCVQLFVTPWTAARQASLSFTISWSPPKLMCIELVMPSNHLILCRPLLLTPSIFPSIRVFSNGLTLCIRWPKYWSFSFSISPSNGYSELISFRVGWLDLLALWLPLQVVKAYK